MGTKEVLKELGLSGGEVKVYLALLKLGETSVSKLTKETGQHRTTIYDFLEHLLQRGLVNYVVKSGVKYYKVADPDKLIEYLKEKEEKLKQILPELKQLAKVPTGEVNVEVYSGVEGFKSVLNDRLRVGKDLYGFGVDEEISGNDLFQFPVNFLLDYIEIGLNSGTYKGKARNVAEEIVAQKGKTALAVGDGETEVKDKVEYCVRYLMVDEVAKRNMVLLEVGLVPRGHFHQQTKVRDDVGLILPMKRSNANHVEQLYRDTEQSPIIIPLCDYAGIEGEINDPFGSTIDDFRKTRDLIGTAVKKSIDRAVEEYLR